MKAIVLAAGRGKRFGAKTKTLPKCLVPLNRQGSHLLGRYLDIFRATGIQEVVIVVGHLKEKIMKECRLHGQGLRIRFIKNPEYTRGSLVSLYCASSELRGSTLIMDADVYFEAQALKDLIKSGPRSIFLVDKRSKSAGEEMMLMAKGNRPVHISKQLIPGLRVIGEATGIFKLGPKDAPALKNILKRFYDQGIKDVEYEEAYCELLKKKQVGLTAIRGFWSEMDFVEDRKKISARFKLVKSPDR